MNDMNLISSSTLGLLMMLQIAQEFYKFNNTKTNFNKAILICNRDPADNSLPLPLTPLSYCFALEASLFEISSLPMNDSFRFLGVWFILSLSSTYVKKQCTTEYSLFTNKLCLTCDQLKYLHNSVLLPKINY